MNLKTNLYYATLFTLMNKIKTTQSKAKGQDQFNYFIIV